MIVLGIHGGFTINQHEPSVALVIDGEVVAVCEEERYNRNKSSYGLMPLYSLRACLDIGKVTAKDIDLVVVTGATYDFQAQRVGHYLKHNFGIEAKVDCAHHQQAHLACAYYASGVSDAMCLSLDATGDASSGFVAYASGKTASGEDPFIKHLDLPTANSLGFFYTLLTHYLGFQDGDEYKVMGLAPYGTPNIDLSQILEIEENGWMLNRSFFRSEPPCKSPFEPMYSTKLETLLGQPNRTIFEPLSEFHQNLAASTQKHFEQALLNLVTHWHKQLPHTDTLCFAGGVAMNCVANEVIRQSGLFKNIFIPPMSSDRGLSLGCAYLGAQRCGDAPRPIKNAYLGSSYDNDHILKELESNSIACRQISDPSATAATLLSENKIIGWFQGASEAGARALGNRSILASPKTLAMRDEVNKRIKFREKFRPFAPAVLAERADDYFKLNSHSSPWMCFACEAQPQAVEQLKAVVHVDNTSRVQTVSQQDNPMFYEVIKNFGKLTDTPVVLNTSFNLKGQPIIETPRDALMTFFGCGLDALFLGDFLVEK